MYLSDTEQSIIAQGIAHEVYDALDICIAKYLEQKFLKYRNAKLTTTITEVLIPVMIANLVRTVGQCIFQQNGISIVAPELFDKITILCEAEIEKYDC